MVATIYRRAHTIGGEWIHWPRRGLRRSFVRHHPLHRPSNEDTMTVRALRRSAYALLVVASVAEAQSQAGKATSHTLTTSQQIAAAVLPAPAELRDAATVFGYDAKGKLGVVRQGTGALNCLAPDPAGEKFHVACYNKSMEPFMARGRALRASGVKDPQVDTVRFKEVKEGKIVMPTQPAVLYTLTGSWTGYDAAKATPA